MSSREIQLAYPASGFRSVVSANPRSEFRLKPGMPLTVIRGKVSKPRLKKRGQERLEVAMARAGIVNREFDEEIK